MSAYYYDIKIFSEETCLSFIPYQIPDSLDISFINESNGTIRTSVSEKSELELLRSSLNEIARNCDITVTVQKKINKNWNKQWEEQAGTVYIKDYVEVYPSFKSPRGDTPYSIEITPQNAFGTGHHATTYQVMNLMKSLNFKEKRILDFGCGTGILGILAHLSGASQVDFIDNDKKCTENTLENLSHNNIQSDFSVITGESKAIPETTYDIVLANVYQKVLLDAAPEFLRRTKHILLSGLRPDAEEKIKEAYQPLDISRKSEKENWIALELKS